MTEYQRLPCCEGEDNPSSRSTNEYGSSRKRIRLLELLLFPLAPPTLLLFAPGVPPKNIFNIEAIDAAASGFVVVDSVVGREVDPVVDDDDDGDNNINMNEEKKNICNFVYLYQVLYQCG